LVSAPTGSGKTLTAFLWAIDNFQNIRTLVLKKCYTWTAG